MFGVNGKARVAPFDTLAASLLAAAQSNIAGDNDVSPILDLIEQGCDLDLDVLPTIARRVQRDSRRGARLSSLTFGRPPQRGVPRGKPQTSACDQIGRAHV